MSDGFEDIEIPVWEGELKAAPDRYPVPAVNLPPLDAGTLVTFGEPGGWWAIDEGYAVTPPVGRGPDAKYGVLLLAEEAGWLLRSGEEVAPDGSPFARAINLRARDLWIYRDHDDEREINELSGRSSLSWLDRLLRDDPLPRPFDGHVPPASSLPSSAAGYAPTAAASGSGSSPSANHSPSRTRSW